MKLKFKQYKTSKLIYYINTAPLFFVFHGVNLKLNNWRLIEQEFVKLKLKGYRLNNTLTKIVLMTTIFKHLNIVLNGPCFFVKLSSFKIQKNLKIKKNLLNIHKLMTFLCLRMNNKLYTSKQFQKISKMHYFNSLQKFKGFLQNLLLGLFKKL